VADHRKPAQITGARATREQAMARPIAWFLLVVCAYTFATGAIGAGLVILVIALPFLLYGYQTQLARLGETLSEQSAPARRPVAAAVSVPELQ
jgi:uncharacterized protein (DUF58 family)